AVPKVCLPLHALPDEARALGVVDRAFVEAVALELDPVVAELAEEKLDEQARRRVGEAPAAKARMDGEPLEPRDPAALVRDGEAEHPSRRPPVPLGHLQNESAEDACLLSRARDLGEDRL